MGKFRKWFLTKKEAKKLWTIIIPIFCTAVMSMFIGLIVLGLVNSKIIPPYEFLEVITALLFFGGVGTMLFLLLFVQTFYPGLFRPYAENEGSANEEVDYLTKLTGFKVNNNLENKEDIKKQDEPKDMK